MKTRKKLLALLSAILFACTGVVGGTASAVCQNGDCAYCPTIIVPGLFQSEVIYYDEYGNEMKNADGDSYSKPFFMESTTEIVKAALDEAVLPLVGELITQQDKNAKAANAFAEVAGRVVMGNILCDKNGKVIKNLKATEYTTSLAQMSEYDRAYCLDMVPMDDYVKIAGADHLYYFSYISTGNLIDTAQRLYDYIQTVKTQTGHDKVNLVPISQGGSVFNALMQLYKDNEMALSDDINRVCLIVPASDGAAVLGDIYRYGLLDDDEALYGYMIPSLMDADQEWLSYMINFILRYFPNDGLNKLLDAIIDTLIGDYLSYSTCIWGLVPSGDYEVCRAKYLSDAEHSEIVKQTDWYYHAQLNAKAYISEAKAQGVEFFDIVDYDYALYRIVDSWQTLNADGIIHTASESLGATCAPVGQRLGDDYVQQGTYCTDPTHNHMDETKTVDATTGILCESTFYFKGQDHEKTASNDAIIRLAIRMLTDSTFTDVYSDEAYPQFNYARNSRKMKELLNTCAKTDITGADSQAAKEYADALQGAQNAYDSTVMKTEEYIQAYERLDNALYKAQTGKDKQEETQSFFITLLTKIFKKLSDFMLNVFGGKGFSDILLFR